MGIAISDGVSPITTLLHLGVPEWDRPDFMLRIHYYSLYAITVKMHFRIFCAVKQPTNEFDNILRLYSSVASHLLKIRLIFIRPSSLEFAPITYRSESKLELFLLGTKYSKLVHSSEAIIVFMRVSALILM